MKQTALVYLLWQKNNSVLFDYLSRKSRVVLMLANLCNAEMKREIESMGSRLVTFESLLIASEIDKLRATAAARAEQCRAQMTDVSWISWRNRYSADPAITDAIILHDFAQHVFEGMVMVEALEKLNNQFFVELVIVNEDYMQLTKTVIHWAKSKGVPSLHLAHALQLAKPYTVHGELNADMVAVFGERGAEPYCDIGIPQERIRITGNPAWDIYAHFKQKRELLRQYVVAKHSFDTDAPVLFFGTTSRGEHSAVADNSHVDKTLIAVFRACAELRKTGFPVNLIIKDREANAAFGRNSVMDAASQVGGLPDSFAYVTSETEIHVTAADVVISVDSNLSVEAMLAEVPAVNLITETGVRLGPVFDGCSGIVEVEPENLLNALASVLYDADFRSKLLETANARKHYYNAAVDGSATERVTRLMGEMALKNDISAQPVQGGAGIDVSVIICSINDKKFAAVSANYADLLSGVAHEIIRISDARSMCEGYNRGIKKAQGRVLIFSHDDIKILSPDFWAKLHGHLQRFDLVGVAGTSLLAGSKWLAVGPPFIHGVVCHKTPDGRLSVDQFGAEHSTCVGDIQALDGLFFAANRRVVEHLLFDEETFEGFHFYDIDFSYAAYRAGFRLGVCCNIAIIHDSRGMVDQSWENNAYFFLAKYKNVLPSIKPPSSVVHASTVFMDEESVLTFYKVINGELSAPYASSLRQDKSNFLAKYPDRIRGYWIWEEKTAVSEVDAEIFAERMVTKWCSRPVFHLVIWLVPGEEPQLAATLGSLSSQFYGEWRLSVVSVLPVPDSSWIGSERLKWYQCDAENRLASLNGAVQAVAAGWVAFMPPGARFEPHALLVLADYANARPDWQFIYCDDDRIGPDGTHFDPHFKPDFNPDLLRAFPYMGESVFCTRDLLTALGGYANYTGWENYALSLAASFALSNAHLGHVAKVLVHYPVKRPHWPQEFLTGMHVLSDALLLNHVPATVGPGLGKNTFRVNYKYPGEPLVSILIPTRDKLEYLRPCVESILEKTAYSNYEILIADNQSCIPETLTWFKDIQQRHPQRVKVLPYDAPFNFSAICNYLVSQAAGEYVLLLNNDTQVLQDSWLGRLLSICMRPEVGAVGCRLIYPDNGKIQHAGVVIGLGGVASHVFLGAGDINYAGYMQRAICEQNYSAVTAAVMLVKRETYQAAGGMDEDAFAVLFNDVDLCLKINDLGYRIVYTPHATLIHHESKSIKEVKSIGVTKKLAESHERILREQTIFGERWRAFVEHDPAWNIHLSMFYTDAQVEHALAPGWDVNFHDRPRVLGVPLSGGAGEYRVISPLRVLRTAGLMQVSWATSSKMFHTRVIKEYELARLAPDTILMHVPLDDEQILSLESFKEYVPEVLRVATFDDLLTHVPEKNSFKKFGFKDVERRLREVARLVDRCIVTTEPLRECLLSFGAQDVRVLPNCLEMAKWGGLKPSRGKGQRPRVGWAGAQQHLGDLELIAEVVRTLAQEVEWVFFGMCPDELRPYVHEFHDFERNFDDYPAKLASLNLDLALAPLEIHPFNEAKSNLRLLEYGIMGWPVVCTDIYPYQNAPVKRVENKSEAWVEAILERVRDLGSAQKEGDALRDWVLKNYVMEDHLDGWLAALVR